MLTAGIDHVAADMAYLMIYLDDVAKLLIYYLYLQ